MFGPIVMAIDLVLFAAIGAIVIAVLLGPLAVLGVGYWAISSVRRDDGRSPDAIEDDADTDRS